MLAVFRAAFAPFAKANCAPLKGDATKLAVRWQGAEDLKALAGKPVKFRFSLRSGQLFAFWVSPETSGISRGYVAGGGPGFSKSADVWCACAPYLFTDSIAFTNFRSRLRENRWRWFGSSVSVGATSLK